MRLKPPPATSPTEPERPVCAMPTCDHPAARRYDRPGKFHRWCDRHCRRLQRDRRTGNPRGRPPVIIQPEDPTAASRTCPVHGCVRVRELRGYRKDGTPMFRETCQAHRGTFIQVDPPPPKPRTPWKPDPRADVVRLPLDAFKDPPLARDRIKYTPASRLKKTATPKRATPPDPHRLDVPALIAATVTTAHDGAWDITHQDLRLLSDPRHTRLPAFEVSTLPGLSRPLPTSVVYRVWGMVERGELTPTEDA